MTTRRTFIKTLAAIPPALSFRRGWAASDPSRLALIIGNSAYQRAPLLNPGNDAKAVAGLLTQAGFTVDSRLDTTRVDMIAAIERFGAAANRSQAKLVVFYYAGHGAQLDWRNYLLPVDAVVEKQEHVKQRCVDLGVLLGQLSAEKDKSFVIILDACRDDPFGIAYRPEHKGLSQFDAPVGSLLAYATSPGRAAADGTGKHGLYTEHLVRELSVRNMRIEDALKKVRLNVRLMSNGEQIPWETTSLESDVYLFSDGAKNFSDSEIEKMFEEEIAQWNRIKASQRVDDWVAYLRSYPNGRFAEIAQVRLNRMLAAAKPITPPSAAIAAAGVKAAPAIDLKPGGPAPQLFLQSENPFSAGRYPLGRKYAIGDEASFKQSDLLTGMEVRTYTLRVTRVDPDADRVELNGGESIWDMMGNPLKSGARENDAPIQFFPAELQIGKKWTAAFKMTINGQTSNAYYDMHISAREKVSVPAGEFDAFRIDGAGWNNTFGNQLEVRLWLVPGLIVAVKREWVTRNRGGRFTNTERHELVSLRQQGIDVR